MDKTIDFEQLLKILKKYLWLIIFLPALFMNIGLLVSMFLITPKFEATTQVLVNETESDNEYMTQQVESNLQLVNTYSEIIKSPRILDQVSDELDDKYDTEDLSLMLDVSNETESQILNISIKNENAKESEVIANTIAEIFSDEIVDIMNVDNVSILSVADDSSDQVEPKTIINSLVGLFLGLILVFLIIFLTELFDKRIKDEDAVAEELGLSVLGTITKIK